MLRQVVQVSNVMSQFGDVPTCNVKDINKIFLPFRRYSNFTQNFGDVPTCNVTSKNLTFFPFGDIPTQQFGAFPTFFFGDSNVNRFKQLKPGLSINPYENYQGLKNGTLYVVHTYMGYKNRSRYRTNLSQNIESYQQKQT